MELLLDSFPSFGEAAGNGLIGTQIGLYIYYKDGEDDVREHRVSPDALAYVSAGQRWSTVRYSTATCSQ